MEDTIDNYLRVKVLSVVARNEFDEPSEVIVKFIDYHSDFITVKVNIKILIQFKFFRHF